MILTVVGARPQFIKAAAVSRVLRARHREILVNTGQHYDDGLSDRFFRELAIPQPDHNLGVGSGLQGEQTARMLTGIERIIQREQPDVVLVYGDTNSTLAGALAASKLHVKVAHVEAGLRSFNRRMPEEVNRVVADHVSDMLFCPSDAAAGNLAREGITRGVHVVGDVMAEVLERFGASAGTDGDLLQRFGMSAGRYILATVHRAENTDDPTRLRAIVNAFGRLEEPVVFPAHPRVRKALELQHYQPPAHVHLIDPVGYFEVIALQRNARMLMTDSGGMQKEAYWLGVPCITLREETEWTETVDAGWNTLVGADSDRIVEAVRTFIPPRTRPPLYVCGSAAESITDHLGEQA